MVDVVPVTTRRHLEEVLALRAAVLVGERGYPDSVADDPFDRDATTLHCMVIDANGVCVGTGRLTAPVDREDGGALLEGNPILGPIVVAPTARGGGVARAILDFLEREALAMYGRNGTVRVEAWVPEGSGASAARRGYTVAQTGLGGGEPWPWRAYKDLAAS